MNAENEGNIENSRPFENTASSFETHNPLPPTQHPLNTTPLQPLTPMSPTTPMPPSRVKIRIGKSFPYGTALIVLVLIVVCAGALYAFAGAEVKVTPMSFTATNGTGDLPYTVVTITKTLSTTVPAESTETANDSAQGTIIISNAQTKPQTLITNTRFATPQGLIYRIHSPVTVPPESANGPGTVSATVYADAPGQNYNIGETTFTLPGLAGSSLATLVTAKSATPMTGGFSGTRPAVSQTTDDSQHASLQSALAATIQSTLNSQIPAGYVVVPGGTQTTYQALSDTATSTKSNANSVAITEQGTLSAIAFPSDSLAKAIAYKIAGTYAGEPISLQSANTMNLTADASTTDFASLSTAILAGFSEVNKATLILRPFWNDTFPQDPSHIHITVISPVAPKP